MTPRPVNTFTHIFGAISTEGQQINIVNESAPHLVTFYFSGLKLCRSISDSGLWSVQGRG